MQHETRSQKVYDSPTRIFHWLFAGLFIFAFFIAKTVDSESPQFSYHMLAGLMLGFTVLLRIVWGFVGTRYARFSSFALRPKDLYSYMIGVLKGGGRRWAGHNPASSWATILMLALALGLAGTGSLMTTGAKETYEDLHEVFANIFLIVVLGHVAGVVLHALKHKDGIALSMIDGQKTSVQNSAPISGNKNFVALLFVVLLSVFGGYLYKNYDRENLTLNLFGTTLSLGENESEESNRNEGTSEKGEEDEDHDD